MAEEILVFTFLLLMLLVSNLQAWFLRTYYRKIKCAYYKLITSLKKKFQHFCENLPNL
jgi:hypothetical protein